MSSCSEFFSELISVEQPDSSKIKIDSDEGARIMKENGEDGKEFEVIQAVVDFAVDQLTSLFQIIE